MVFADFDGDGYDDVAYVKEDRVFVWLNQSGNAYAAPDDIPWRVGGGPLTQELDSCRRSTGMDGALPGCCGVQGRARAASGTPT